jgi:hypothetical protein
MTEEGWCYCQSECQCVNDVDDDSVILMTREMEDLPAICS